jgi:hypothetical protein
MHRRLLVEEVKKGEVCMFERILLAFAAGLLMAGCADYEYLENPPQPVAVTIGAVTDSSVALHWTKSADDYFERYTVYFATEERIDSSSKAADTLFAAFDTTTIVSGLDSTTRYYFRVVIANEYGMSAGSAIVDTTTLKSARSPLRLFHPDSTTDSSTVIRWERSWHSGFDGYQISIDTTRIVDTNATPLRSIRRDRITDTSVAVTGLLPGTRYWVAVHVKADGHFITSSATDSLTTRDGRPVKSVLAVVDGSVTDTSVAVQWSRNRDADFSRYVLVFDTSAQIDSIAKPGSMQRGVSRLSSANDTGITIHTLSRSKRYYFCLYVEDLTGLVSSSNIDSVTTQSGTPAKVGMWVIDSLTTDTSVTLKWNKSPDNDFKCYLAAYDTVFKSIDSIKFFNREIVHFDSIADSARITTTIRLPKRSQKYYFTMYIQDRSSLVSAACIDSATTASGIPARVTLSKLDNSVTTDTSVVLQWTKTTDADFSRYMVLYDTIRFVDSVGRKQSSAITHAADTMLVLTGLFPNRWYWFNVRVEDRDRLSSFSPTDSVQTVKPIPRPVDSLKVEAKDSASITLTWTPYSGKYFKRFLIVKDTTWYSLEKRTSFDAGYQPAIPAIEATRYTITGLKPSTLYYLTVYVENVFGDVVAAKRVEASTR